MAIIGSTISLTVGEQRSTGYGTAASSITNQPVTLIDAGGLDDAFASGNTVTSKDLMAIAADNLNMHVGTVKFGTAIMARVFYLPNTSVSASPVVQFFGLKQVQQPGSSFAYNNPATWEPAYMTRLYDGTGYADSDTALTMTVAVTEANVDDLVTVGGVDYRVTGWYVWYLQGCKAVVPVVKVAQNTNADDSKAFLQVQVI